MLCELFHPYVKGGSEKRYWEISRRLAEEDDVHIFTMRPPGTDQEETVDNISIHRIFNFTELYTDSGRRKVWPAVGYSLSLMKEIFGRFDRFDIVDCSSFPYIPSFSAKLLSSKWSSPLVVTFHEVWGSYWNQYLNSSIGGRIGIFFEEATAHIPNKIVAVSRWTASALSKTYGVPKAKIDVIPNGVDLRLFDSVIMNRDPFKVLFVGRLISHKHLDWLIAAMSTVKKRFPNSSLHVVGDGPIRPELEELVSKYSLSKNTTFYGALSSYRSVAEHMKSASVLVSPSTREGFNMVALEAIVAGTPVVIVDAPNNAALDFVKHRRTGLVVETGNPQAIADAIIELFEDEKLRRRLVENALQTAYRYSWDEIAQAMRRVYQKAAIL
ncbi:MAG: glycosyltransferase family 4 protein [Candidatus Bathyarchaeota archaeon]|nr:MAG: glycosyltransferase family 4 protein [Candidatus Bathyarchaeota archaeon]